MPDDPPSSPREPFRPVPDPSWRERVDAVVERARVLPPRVRLVAAVVASVVVAAMALALLRPAGAASAPEVDLPRATESSSPAAPSSLSAQLVVVQAAGAVAKPGVYRLASGMRVDDLVRAAGGLAPDADPDRVNLAALLTDGEKVYVPRMGETIPTDAAGTDATASTSGPIDLNAASITQLETLPGVGPATAQAIVDYRTQHGRFQTVDDLLNVRGIGPQARCAARARARVIRAYR